MPRKSHLLSFEHISWVVISIFLLNLVSTSQGGAPTSHRSTDEQDIREAVLRKEMQDWIRDGDKAEAEAKDETEIAIAKRLNFGIFFISVNDKDPGDDLMTKLKDIPRVVKKLSASEISKGQRIPVVYKSSRQRGIIFSADRVRWVSKDSAEVEGGYHCDGLCAAGIKFRVKRENGKWVIESSKMEWIS